MPKGPDDETKLREEASYEAGRRAHPPEYEMQYHRMETHRAASRGGCAIIPALIVLAAIGAAVWFFFFR